MQATLAVLLITGGHDFERPQFAALFDGFEGVTWREVTHPDANAMLKRGKGLVVLHHALADYQAWDEWRDVIGGRYYLAPTERDGKQIPASTYRHGVDINLHVVDPEHPVTKGLTDFTIHDEVYGGYEVLPTVHPLLTTDNPESSPTIAWTNTYGNSRVVTIQLGHDHLAWENPNYRKLVSQAIRWVAEKP
jgi:type 1 glutamine amidotransferase